MNRMTSRVTREIAEDSFISAETTHFAVATISKGGKVRYVARGGNCTTSRDAAIMYSTIGLAESAAGARRAASFHVCQVTTQIYEGAEPVVAEGEKSEPIIIARRRTDMGLQIPNVRMEYVERHRMSMKIGTCAPYAVSMTEQEFTEANREASIALPPVSAVRADDGTMAERPARYDFCQGWKVIRIAPVVKG